MYGMVDFGQCPSLPASLILPYGTCGCKTDHCLAECGYCNA